MSGVGGGGLRWRAADAPLESLVSVWILAAKFRCIQVFLSKLIQSNLFHLDCSYPDLPPSLQEPNKRSSAKATAGAMSPFDLQDVNMFLLMGKCYEGY